MTLRELQAILRRHNHDDENRSTENEEMALADADGIRFLCPKCYEDAPRGPVGTHSIICWFVGRVPDSLDPRPGRWVPRGRGIDDLSFVGPSSASVALTGGCCAHFYVRNGAIEMLPV